MCLGAGAWLPCHRDDEKESWLADQQDSTCSTCGVPAEGLVLFTIRGVRYEKTLCEQHL
jgi:hypothetical protein